MEAKITLKEQRDFYDKKYAEAWLHETNSYYEWILSLAMRYQKSGRFLDIACGEGFVLNAAESKGFETHGIDISKVAIKKAKKLCRKTKFRMSSADDMPYPANHFNILTCLGSLEHFADQKKSVAEMKRVMKNGGVLVATLPNKKYIGDIIKGKFYKKVQTHDQPLERFYTVGEGKKLFEENGLKVVKIKKYNSPDSLMGRWIWKKVLMHILPLHFSYHICYIAKKE